MIRRPPSVLLGLCLWLLLEYAAFLLVAHFAGIAGAIMLGLGTMILGIVILRNLGRGAARHLREALDRGRFSDGHILDGFLSALGAILLILPGFISDLIGLTLAAPSMRQWIARRFGGKPGQRPSPPNDTIDLSPGEWHQVDANLPAQNMPQPRRSKITRQAPDIL